MAAPVAARLLACAALALAAASASAQRPHGHDRHNMSPEDRRQLREAMRDARRDPEPRREMPPPGGRMSPEEREKLRRDLMDANRGLPRR